MERLQPTGQPADLTDPPDPALLVSRNIATGPYPMHATVRLPVGLDQALRLIPATVGAHRPDGPDATVVDVGGPGPDGLARYLLSLATPLRVLAPDSVRQALRRRTRALLAALDEDEPSDSASAKAPDGRA
ncbi:WYL domain-containing protein [Streptomyces sp. Amel2xE9]|uniref:WYL domain-containing protein n=1 Tax=Streptomyces sp. SID8381 TaxID=2690361 RepID=UPI0003A29CB9|nr:WYL domain-containing protein [Streptomyces sp. Amel2xE9]